MSNSFDKNVVPAKYLVIRHSQGGTSYETYIVDQVFDSRVVAEAYAAERARDPKSYHCAHYVLRLSMIDAVAAFRSPDAYGTDEVRGEINLLKLIITEKMLDSGSATDSNENPF